MAQRIGGVSLILSGARAVKNRGSGSGGVRPRTMATASAGGGDR